MQVQAVQSRTGTREVSLAAPLCVLLAQLQSLTGAEPPARAPVGHHPLLALHLASQLLPPAADRPRLLAQLVNPPAALLQELLIATLARRAVLAAADSEERALYDWQRQQQCWLLTTIAARLLDYPDVEAAGLASVYCLLDADVAQSLPVPQLWRDLVDTLHLPAADLRDTALLSRLVWCCHQLQRHQLRLDGPMLAACSDLLGWPEVRVRAWIEESQVALKQRCQSFGVTAGIDQLQRDSISGDHWLQELKLQALRQLTHSGYLQQLQPLVVESAADLLLQVQRVLLRHQLPLRFLLLAVPQPGASELTLLLGGDSDSLQQEFAIPLNGGRSMLASLVQQDTRARLRLGDAVLAPVDRQLLRLLGSESALCLPLRGRRAGALLLPDAAPDNPELHSLGRIVQQLLDSLGQTPDASSQSVALLQQQVRDVVHEANNPLAIMKNYLQVLALKYPDNVEAREQIGILDGEIDRVVRLLQTLRHNVVASSEKHEIDLNELVRSHHKWLSAAFAGKPALVLACKTAAQPAIVAASPAALTQVLLNLVKNAAEALGDSGNITLVIKRNVHLADRLNVLLEVSDDGPGLDATRMQKLFSPGSSTKGGTHSGAGLAIVKKLVDDLQGHISCHSDNNGTTFSIMLPQVR